MRLDSYLLGGSNTSCKPYSDSSYLSSVVSQGSCLAVLLFNIYVSSLFDIISNHAPCCGICLYHLRVGDVVVATSTVVQNLGSYFHKNLTMATNVTKTCSAAFCHLHNIR